MLTTLASRKILMTAINNTLDNILLLSSQLSQNFDFLARPCQDVVKRDASAKKGKLSCCKMLFGLD